MGGRMLLVAVALLVLASDSHNSPAPRPPAAPPITPIFKIAHIAAPLVCRSTLRSVGLTFCVGI